MRENRKLLPECQKNPGGFHGAILVDGKFVCQFCQKPLYETYTVPEQKGNTECIAKT